MQTKFAKHLAIGLFSLCSTVQQSYAQAESGQGAIPQTPTEFQAAPMQTDQLQAAKPIILRGSAEIHSEALPPVDPRLQAGSIFNEQALPKPQLNNDWYLIPAWYAGTKHMETQTILQDYDFRTGETLSAKRTILNRQDLSIGFQMDATGQIWEFKRAPYTATTDGGGTFTKTFVRSREPLQVNQGTVVVRLVETSVLVDKQTNRIMRTLQEEQVNTYTPAGQGALNIQSSIKGFGADGQAQMQQTSVRAATQVAPFQAINNYNGMDMRLLFRDFMIAHGFANLLPAGLAPTNTEYANPYPPQGMQAPLQGMQTLPQVMQMPQQGMQTQPYVSGREPIVIDDPSAPPVAPPRSSR